MSFEKVYCYVGDCKRGVFDCFFYYFMIEISIF